MFVPPGISRSPGGLFLLSGTGAASGAFNSMAIALPFSLPRRRLWPRLVEAVCRAGYAARGLVYVSIGWIALLAAPDLTPRPQGAEGALQAWAEWPFGLAVIGLVGAGLAAFALWRFLQSVLDADRQGRKPKALAARAGQAISGLVYGGLALSAFELLDAFGDLTEQEDREATRAAVSQALEMPGGAVLVIVLGGFVLACGVGGLVQGALRDFCRDLDCSHGIARRAALLGRTGYAARGLVFLTAGLFTVMSGVQAHAEEAQGIASALQWLARLPAGPAVLAAIALGLMAFGAFALVEARYRRMNLHGVVA